jgi:phosphate transport system substrate-binding protein
VIANDGIAVVVHKDNKTSGLTLDQLKQIYTGAISTWKELGGPATGIVLVSRDVSSGTYEVFNEKALKGAKVSDGALMVASNQAVAATVAQTPGAIGYIGVGYLTPEVKALTIDNVVPSKETVLNGSYKLARKLYMYTNGQPKGEAKKFIDFILSDAGQKIVQEVGFITIK